MLIACNCKYDTDHINTVIIISSHFWETYYLSTDFKYVKGVRISSKFRTVPMFETCDLEFVSMFTSYPHTAFHMPKPIGSLVVAVKPESWVCAYISCSRHFVALHPPEQLSEQRITSVTIHHFTSLD
jgi:hypothetical protein